MRLGTMHHKDGWFFRREDNGAVTILKFDPPYDFGMPEDQAVLTLTIPANEWASILAHVCGVGEHAVSFEAAEHFHREGAHLMICQACGGRVPA